ncbi:phosphatase PAP2 family protein [Pontibacter sp. E15-1]|uniref:phosphatase PAP2 family protein n=1 Tax=Pontibacter sp. E15-1 TaxID=2919918 RepID=UPI001F4F273A|nr:phosphatase PAP2 family protein [Pontibacter sp. E15-1]MCJ8166122.1 phosphatase PAP2 family protein [Pontibacter sp. E15-1]
MRLNKFLTVHLLWLTALFSPAIAQPQQLQLVSSDSLDILASDTTNAIPADSIVAGQKNPFTDAQRLEADNKRYFKRAVIPAAALIGVGLYTIQGNGIFSSFDARDARNNGTPNFSTKLDDYLFFVPIAYLYGFDALSSQNRHDIGRQTGLLFASIALTSAVVWPTKTLTDIDRPNGDPTAFPSGHTAYAFTIATLVDKEFRHKSPWVSIGSYSIATATGVMRVLNNEHWMSDVLAGAGVGILSVNTVYWVHAKLLNSRALKNAGLNTSFAPTVLPTGNMGMRLSMQF